MVAERINQSILDMNKKSEEKEKAKKEKKIAKKAKKIKKAQIVADKLAFANAQKQEALEEAKSLKAEKEEIIAEA